MNNPHYFPEFKALSGVPYHVHTDTPEEGESEEIITGTNRQVVVFDTDSEELGKMKAGLFRPEHWSEITNGAPTENGTWLAAFTNSPVDPNEDMFFVKNSFIPEFGAVPSYDVNGELFVYTGDDVNHAVNRGDLQSAIDGVTLNVTNRNNQTGTQSISTISGLQTQLESKVNNIEGMGLSQTSFTQAEKTKLSSIVEHFAGRFVSLEDLNSVQGVAGGYAYVSINNDPTVLYAWNVQTAEWESTILAVTEESPESVKIKYETNADTNSYSDAEKSKLAGIAATATKNDTDVNLKNRANHTGTQAASTIIQSATERFTTDVEKVAWNAKQSALVSGTNIKTVNGVSIIGSGNISTTGTVNTSVSNFVRINEYANRFEYIMKTAINASVGVSPANYSTVTTTIILPVGVTIDGCDEHYISVRNDNRAISVSVWDNANRNIVLGFHNSWSSENTAKGSVFIKLVKYK